MLKTYELQEMIKNYLNDFKPSEEWEDFLMTEVESTHHDTIRVNFIEVERDGRMIDNQFEIKIRRVEE